MVEEQTAHGRWSPKDLGHWTSLPAP
jgi:hypothetical protein